MASLSNQYQCIDDTGLSAGPAGGQTGGASGQPLGPVFTVATIASAITVAHITATAYQRPVRLVAFGGNPPWTLVTGNPAATAITACPSGVGY